ncbi:hypothetical protein [Mycolicibacterium tusciae]|uniref:hypothetical protein n=1 Tax=Mycolicibacterium tusciae TaxID=75922 RepID=UPI00269074C5
MPELSWDFSGLRALLINCTLKKSPELSNTGRLIDMHLARMLRDGGGVPAYGNLRTGWDAGCRYDFENPEYR